MLNQIIIMGRFVADPEVRYTNQEQPVANFRIACDRDYKPEGADKAETDFINCVAWRKTAEFVKKYFAKGKMAVVSGRLEIQNWEDKDGNKRISAEIKADSVYFCGSKSEEGGNASAGPTERPAQSGGVDVPPPGDGFDKFNGGAPFSDLSDADGDLPFSRMKKEVKNEYSTGKILYC